MKALKYISIFAVGAAAGSAITWFIAKTKYEKIINDEINAQIYDIREESIKMREEKINELDKVKNKMMDLVNQTDQANEDDIEYGEIIEADGTITNPVDDIPEPKEKEETDYIEPYVISPEEFDEKGYNLQTLIYYADGYLTDDMDFPIVDIDGTVGEDAVNHFGEYEDDSVFIRNDNTKIDYEILADSRNFKDITKSREEFMAKYNRMSD